MPAAIVVVVAAAVVCEWRHASSKFLCVQTHVHNLRTRDFVLHCASTCDESNHLFVKNPAKKRRGEGGKSSSRVAR